METFFLDTNPVLHTQQCILSLPYSIPTNTWWRLGILTSRQHYFYSTCTSARRKRKTKFDPLMTMLSLNFLHTILTQFFNRVTSTTKQIHNSQHLWGDVVLCCGSKKCGCLDLTDKTRISLWRGWQKVVAICRCQLTRRRSVWHWRSWVCKWCTKNLSFWITWIFAFDIEQYAAVRRDSTVLGNVAQMNMPSCRRHPPSYLIESADGRTLHKIARQNSWRNYANGLLPVNDFNVLSPDGSICKAKISRQTNAITLEEYSQTDTYALSFHTTDMVILW